MIYLAVNKDGTEGMYNYNIERFNGLCNGNNIQQYEQLLKAEDVGKSDFWTMRNDEGCDFPKLGRYANYIFLPKGTIKKLIGKDLTWDDNPYKYE